MKLYVLKLGDLTVNARVIDGADEAEKSYAVPVWALLVRHEKGNLLFDTGCAANALLDGAQGGVSPNGRLTYAAGETLRAQLALLGMTPGDIDTVIVSHMHDDHCGGLSLFPHARVYAPVQCEGNVRVITKDGGYDLPDGIEIVTLPGHTPNLLGLCVSMKGKTLMFPADCIYYPKNRESLPGYPYDAEAYRRSIEKLDALCEARGAQIIYSHWNEQYALLPKAPAALAED